MIEATNIYADRRMPVRRNDSFSTVDSVVGVADNAHELRDYNRQLQKPVLMANNVTNVKFDNSESIHIGNIVYHIHHHSRRRIDNKDSDSIGSDPFGSYTVEAFENLDNLPPNGNKNKYSFRIIAAIISVILMFISASVASYFALRHNNKGPDFLPSTTEYTTVPSTTVSETEPPASSTTTIGYTTTTESYFEIFDYKNGTDRSKWGALPPKSSNIPKLDVPIKRIIIGHTGGNFCSNETECIETMKSLQFINPDLEDIAYNFLIGGDGKIYEGRGFNYQGQHTKNLDATEFNSIGICIAFIGNYARTVPSFEQYDLLRDFIETFVKNQLITKDYIVVLQDDLVYSETKAVTLNNVIRNLQNYRPLQKIYRREEWGAQRNKGIPTPYNIPMKQVVIDHSLTPQCENLNDCKARARSLQDQSLDRFFDDISYNIFFGANGLVFEGRGWDFEESHRIGFNSKVIDIGAIGNFTSVSPDQGMVGAMLQVFDDAMALGKLTNDYKIFGLNDFGGSGPGAAFMQLIKAWCRYGYGTKTC
ncbi:peptidoglycan recognition protein 3-like [Chironomus tepperi]|uniref:peptidoglycan recognition protein 3-like n=1 Tax=Chironomus tepperi TaxID=113505 RepID=UPI00391F02CC